MKEKFCSSCATKKPINQFHGPYRRKSRKRAAYYAICKDCVRIKNHNDYERRKEAGITGHIMVLAMGLDDE